jgi:hypothetical protein
MVTILPPLRTMVRVRCPRSSPSRSMVAPIASETRSPLSCQQQDQRMIGGASQAGGDEQCAHLIAVKAGGVRLVVEVG